MCGPDRNGSDPAARSSSAIPAGLAPYAFPPATSTSPLLTSLWSQATKQLLWRAATQLSHPFVHFRLPPSSPAMPVIMMNRSVCRIVWIQPFCCRQSQRGTAWAEDAASCLAWRPGAAGRAGALSSAVPPSLWIWREDIPGGTLGMGDPSKSRMTGRGRGGTSTLSVSLVQSCLRSRRPEIVHPYGEAQVCQLRPTCCPGS